MALADLVIMLLVALAGEGADGRSDAALLEQAESAFYYGWSSRDTPARARQSFRAAAVHYEVLRQRGAHNAALYRNLGNAHLLAGDLSKAILAYRRGSRMAPADRALHASLAHARAQVAYASPGSFARPPEAAWLRWLCRLWPRERLVLTMLSYSLACLVLTRWRMLGRTWLLRGGTIALAAAVLLTASLAVDEWDKWSESRQPLVVIADDGVLLRKGNGLTYPPRYETPLNCGVEARLRFARGEWVQIELTGGEVGWVPRVYTLIDTP